MKISRKTLLAALLGLTLVGAGHAEESALKGVKLGFGFDQGFGVAGSIDKFNGFIGNDGIAVDYIFARGRFNKTDPVNWYVGGGGFGEWGDGAGIRVPFGVELSFAKTTEPSFAKHWDIYGQLTPNLKLGNDSKFGLDAGIGLRYLF